MSEFLDRIDSPDDLKRLQVGQLEALADEIRQFIIGSVSKSGGHLASNLGVVEVTLALHYVFDFSKDRLLWDVGHQCYAHKIITGRKDKFALLRQAEGISGFPSPEESPYDQFTVGHAGTAVATAIGMALGQSQIEGKEKIVAVVGDASIVNGLSFEALNNLGLVKRQLLIVLNDNSMAIDATAGSVAKYFSRIRLSNTYEDLVRTTNNILEHLPVIGKGVEEVIERIKKHIRMAMPASQMFESLNIPYFGPVDGHDVESLVQLFGALGKLDHPAILHVYTKKGKGFSPAEQDRRRFHSTGPFEMNGEASEADPGNGRKSFTNVFGDKLVELAGKDERIVAITSAMADGTGLARFRKEFPQRFYDVGIAESAAVDIAAGMAKTGLKPVVCIYSTFLQRSFDQIFQEVALQNLPVVFCVDRAGLVGADGPTHHGLMDIGFLRMMPNVLLVGPSDGGELEAALEFALDAGRPVVIRYPKDIVPEDDFERAACAAPFEAGKSVTVRPGEDGGAVIVAYGVVLTEALAAAERLGEEGVETTVINARFAAPIDEKIIRLLEEGKGLVTVEDHRLACGFGSAVLEAAAEAFEGQIPSPIRVLGVPKSFVRHDLRAKQFIEAGITADKIMEVVKEMLARVVK
jgi:1-deoxy-D-xylulose-5-phosphate synthase